MHPRIIGIWELNITVKSFCPQLWCTVFSLSIFPDKQKTVDFLSLLYPVHQPIVPALPDNDGRFQKSVEFELGLVIISTKSLNLSIIFQLIQLCHTCAWMHTDTPLVTVLMCRSKDNLWESAFPHCMGPSNWFQVIRLDQMHPYKPSQP